MEYTQLIMESTRIAQRVYACRDMIQSRFGTSDRFFHRFVAVETALRALYICLERILETTLEYAEDTTLVIPLRPLPKTLTDDQRVLLDDLLADMRAYESAFDAYSFAYHSQLRVCRNQLILKINSLSKI